MNGTIRIKTTMAGPGGTFGPGEYAVPGEVESATAEAMVRGGFAEWVNAPAASPRPVEAAVEAPAAENAAERTVPPWTMKVDPEDYLERWPDGPKADLAQAHLDAEE